MPDIEDDDTDDKLPSNGSDDLRASIAEGMTNQGIDVPPEAVDKSLPSTQPREAKPAQEAAPKPASTRSDPQAPVSFSGQAKAAVAALKAGKPLKADEGQALVDALDKREREINNGFSRLQELKELESHKATFAQHGISLKQAIDGYVHAEQVLKTDFAGVLPELAARYGHDIRQVVATLAQQMGIIGQQAPATPQGMTQQERQAVQELVAHSQRLEQEIATLKSQVSVNRTREIASKARAAGSSISGGPSVTPQHQTPNLSIRELLEAGMSAGGRL